MNRARNNQTTPTPNGANGNNQNGGMNRTMPNGNGENDRGGVLSGALSEQIRSLCFVKTELELFLDTHPHCKTAIDYYHRTIDELNRLTEEYENTVGPLTAKGNVSTEHWTWIDGPWPWQQAGDFMREGKR